MFPRTAPSINRILQRCRIRHRSFSTVTANSSSNFDSNLLQSHAGNNTSHSVSNHGSLEYFMKSILAVHDVNMEQIRLIQKDEFHNRVDHFQKLLMEAQSCVMDCKSSENRTDEEEEKEARGAVKELYFEFLELLDDLNSIGNGSGGKIARHIKRVKNRLEGMEDMIDDCNPLQLQAVIAKIYGTSQFIHDVV